MYTTLCTVRDLKLSTLRYGTQGDETYEAGTSENISGITKLEQTQLKR